MSETDCKFTAVGLITKERLRTLASVAEGDREGCVDGA